MWLAKDPGSELEPCLPSLFAASQLRARGLPSLARSGPMRPIIPSKMSRFASGWEPQAAADPGATTHARLAFRAKAKAFGASLNSGGGSASPASKAA